MYKFILLSACVLLMTQVDFCVFSQVRENVRVTQLKADIEEYPKEARTSVLVRGDYNVVFYMDGVEVGRQVVAFNDRLKAPAYTTERAGRRFLGWYDRNSNSLFDLNGYIRKDYAVEARWECISYYTASFATDGGVFSNAADYTQTLCYRQTTLRPANPTKVGYNFIDWYTNSNLTSVYDFSTAVTADITLYAKWEIKKYSVTLRYNGGGIDKTYTVNHGATVPISPAPYRYKVDGQIYTFKGWYTESYFINAYNVNNAVTGDLTLYAKWEVDPVYVHISYVNAPSQKLSLSVNASNPLAKALSRLLLDPYATSGEFGSSHSHALVCVRYTNYDIITMTVVYMANRSTKAVFDLRNTPTRSAAIVLPSSRYPNGDYEVIVNTEGGVYTQIIRLYTRPKIMPDNAYDDSYSVNGQRKPMPRLDIVEVFELDDATPLFYALPPFMLEEKVEEESAEEQVEEPFSPFKTDKPFRMYPKQFILEEPLKKFPTPLRRIK